MTTAARRLGRNSREAHAREGAIGARARQRRRAAVVGLPQQRGERLGRGRRRAHLAAARHPPPPLPANNNNYKTIFFG